MPDAFDPFNDRLSRDIRNSLSVSFVAVLTCDDSDTMLTVGDHWLGLDLPTACRAYIVDRRRRYRMVLDEVRSQDTSGELEKAVAVWNHGLFFETHELLEGAWRTASGGRKEALKGLIQAAGMFVLRDYGNRRAARRLADRARSLLREYGRHLAVVSNLDDLVAALAGPNSRPPVLNVLPRRHSVK